MTIWAQVAVDIHINVILDCLGQIFLQVLYLGRAPRTKETLPDFREKCRVTRHSRVFRGLTGSQRTPGFGVSHSLVCVEWMDSWHDYLMDMWGLIILKLVYHMDYIGLTLFSIFIFLCLSDGDYAHIKNTLTPRLCTYKKHF